MLGEKFRFEFFEKEKKKNEFLINIQIIIKFFKCERKTDFYFENTNFFYEKCRSGFLLKKQ